MCGNRLRPWLALPLVAVLLCACARAPERFAARRPLAADATAAITLAGANADALRRFLEAYDPASEKGQAARFLLAGLPLADAASMREADLRETVDQAFAARDAFPWGRDVPWDIFLHYVLPHRTSQEPFQPHRLHFFKTLAPRLDGITDMAAAAQEIALWCLEHVAYVPTSRRDQGVMTSLRRGQARCEEAVILFAAAARSVGIPVRKADTPAWQFADDNHAWAEVWINGTWHYIDPANPGPRLDDAWFSENVRNVLVTTATVYGDAPDAPEPVLRQGRGYTVLNTTASYAPVHPLRVRVVGRNGVPVPNVVVLASIYNYAGFRPALRIQCDGAGEGMVMLGKGTVLLTTVLGHRRAAALATITPPRDGDADRPAPVTLDLAHEEPMPAGFWMRFGGKLPAAPLPPLAAAERDAFEADKAARAAQRTERFNSMLRSASNYLAASGNATSGDARLAAILKDAGENGDMVATLVDMIPAPLRQTLIDYLATLSPKDRAACSAAGLRTEPALALAAREHARALWGLAYDDDTFTSFVLANRISKEEPYASYRSSLREQAASWIGADLADTVWRVNAYVKHLRPAPSGVLSPVLTPDQAVRSGHVATDQDRAVASVGILRSLGIPARYVEPWGWVEYFDGAQWSPLFPARPECLDNKAATPASERYYAPWATLNLQCTRDGAPLAPDAAEYFRQFALSSFVTTASAPSLGYFRQLEPDAGLRGAYDATTSTFQLSFPSGSYFLIAGTRNATGEAYVRVRPFALLPGETNTLVGPLDLPQD
ncbi:MAG: transglutaminase domain-containing protein [Desulfovibrionaceae bacterium]